MTGIKKELPKMEALFNLVRKKRLELLRLTALVPKTSASTNSATLAGRKRILKLKLLPKYSSCILYLNLRNFISIGLLNLQMRFNYARIQYKSLTSRHDELQDVSLFK